MLNKAVNWQLTLNSAEHYARYSRFMLEPWVPVLLESVCLKRGEQVLDIACGTGFVARQALRVVGESGKVDGIDINEGMLAVARTSSECLDPLEIHWHTADACELPFGDESFDVALCQQGLQFFPDKVRALCETRRTLKDGGRIGLSVWGRREDNPYFDAIDAVVSRHLGEEPAARLRVPHSMTGPGEVHALLEDAGFRQVDVRLRTLMIHTPPARDYLPNHLNAMPVAEELGALPETARSDLFADLLSSLSRYMDGENLRVPCTVIVCSAVR